MIEERGEKIYGIEDLEIGYIYRVYQGSTQQGYILYMYENGISEAKFTGTDNARDINGKVYHVFPGLFLSKQEFRYYGDSDLLPKEITTDEPLVGSSTGRDYYKFLGTIYYTNITYTIESPHVPDLTSKVTTYTSAFSYKKSIVDVPVYLNGPTGPIIGGCAPTSLSMMIAYYDNNYDNSFSTREGGSSLQFPLTHEYIPGYTYESVDNLIYDLGYHSGICDVVNNCITTGASPSEYTYGLETFLAASGNGNYKGIKSDFVGNTVEYERLINLGNPAVIAMYNHPTYTNHAVLGYGYYRAYQSPSGAIVRDTWSSNSSGVWISYSLLDSFTFIYDN